MKSDRIFDGQLAAKFGRRIYESYKGELRQHLVMRDLAELLARPQQIVDIGGGTGEMSLKLASLGHPVLMAEPSAEMLAQAQARFEKAGVAVACRQASLSELEGQYSLVLFHAVLEWLGEQQQSLAKVMARVAPGGHLSLLFYNRHSIDFNHLIRGNFKHLEKGRYGGHNSLTPHSPLWPEEVYGWLAQEGWLIKAQTGIRCFSDYFQKGEIAPDLATRIQWEEWVANREPYRSLARYIHVLAQKPG
ncbi:methyltransferase domain-containing protein [Gallaecimonas pentaromativorans]|uniref:S-adenosylmethionine-dependent methyltransferase n=1 Tax=Gallaecimonas pentaromativorans TaxID=584787 RepID=A0A3N1PA86_9GAMM|nr:methyltransferase domain-containing protein [Gallaecimonas pentaromativorans]ROQ24949.1 S-adenosylmethionine-dependent methyltransferase [Gallaecimonas pentaromativorans]